VVAVVEIAAVAAAATVVEAVAVDAIAGKKFLDQNKRAAFGPLFLFNRLVSDCE